jgi:hypothetical protein
MRAGRARWNNESVPQAHKVMREGVFMNCSKAVGNRSRRTNGGVEAGLGRLGPSYPIRLIKAIVAQNYLYGPDRSTTGL